MGAPCGGRLELAIQQLDDKDLPWITEANAAVSARRPIIRTVALASGETRISPTSQFAPLEQSDDTLTHCFDRDTACYW